MERKRGHTMKLEASWADVLKEEMDKDYFKDLMGFLDKAYEEKVIYPPKEEVFQVFSRTPFSSVKVVILGQDPYHGAHQAEGLAFSVKKGEKIPPSLRHIHQELLEDLGATPPTHGSLLSWAKEGVLLLNTVLTVEEGKAHSHKGLGWEPFTKEVVRLLGRSEVPKVFILWGNHAKTYEELIKPQHLILSAPHPSPLSARRGFFGTKPFSKANAFLEKHGRAPISWAIPE